MARQWTWIIAGAASVATLAALAAVVALVARDRRERWAHEVAIPAIQRLADAGESDSALALTRRAAAVIPRDPLLGALWPRFSTLRVLRSDPAGARVYRARFDDTTRWEPLGTTPTDSVRVPTSLARYRFEKPGYRPVTILAGGVVFGDTVVNGAVFPRVVPLARADEPDSDMVLVRSTAVDGTSATPPVPLGEFRIGRYEVTNRQYKAFVDAGGYRRREFWTEPFVDGGRTLGWQQGMARLTDRTGRPGPATWEAGAPPAGEEDLPVGGLSWYEAAAYARFAGSALPTVYHWNAAAARAAAAWVVPGSNLASQGPLPVGPARGMSPWGAFDMAGNVREWCLNDDGTGRRYALGGGWGDLTYAFTDLIAQWPLDRAPTNGVRLARYAPDDSSVALASRALPRPVRDYARERPVSEAVFATYRVLYDYDPAPLEARVEARDTTAADWVRERVSFVAAYGPGVRERVTALVFLPKRSAPPYQTVVLFPGGNALWEPSVEATDIQLFGWLMRSGRALVLPVYRGTYERKDGLVSSDGPIARRDRVLAWGKDLRRSVDYLETRADVDTARLAYVGLSMGARQGGLMLAIEPRFKAGVLLAGGFRMAPSRPEVDPLHFLPRVRIPVLMVNGRYDHIFPTEIAQRPYFRLLGTPPEHKRHVLNEEGHFLPRAQVITETLAWLDRYLGPVGR